MKKHMTSLAAAAGLSLIGLAITSIYLMGICLFPGTLNELSLIFGITVMISIAWMKFYYLLDQLQVEELHFKVRHVTGLFVLMAIYSMILIFIGRHAQMQTVPVYMWIMILTTIALFDTVLLTKKNLWVGRISHGITIMFLVSMAQYHDSQFVWLISATYFVVQVFVASMVSYRWKKVELYLVVSPFVIALVLTVVQFWSHLSPIFSWLSDNSYLLILLGAALLTFFYTRETSRKKEKHRQLAESQKLMREKEDRIRKEKFQELQQRLVNKILAKEEISFTEFNELTTTSLNLVKSEWKSLVTQLKLSKLIEISHIKQQIVWDQSLLNTAIDHYNHIYRSSQNDELLQILLNNVKELIQISELKYAGKSALVRHVNNRCTFTAIG